MTSKLPEGFSYADEDETKQAQAAAAAPALPGGFSYADQGNQRAPQSDASLDAWREEMRSKYEHRVPVGEGVARSTLKGLSFQYGDEVAAALGALMQPLVGGQDDGLDIGKRYDAYLAHERDRNKAFNITNPKTALASELAGGTLTGMAMPGSQVTTYGQAARQGAFLGGLYGSGGGTDLGSRAEEAAWGAGAGAAVAPLMMMLFRGGENAVNYVKEKLKALSLKMPRAAYLQLKRAVDQAMPDENIANIRAGGPDAMLGEANVGTQQQMDAMLRRPNEAARMVRDAVEGRVAGASDDVTAAMNENMGQPAGIRRMTTWLRKGTEAARGDAYERAYNTPLDYSDEVGARVLDIIHNRVPPEAIAQANKLMRMELGRGSSQNERRARGGRVGVAGDLPDVQQIDYLTRALYDVSYGSVGQGKMGGKTDVGRAAGNLARELRDLVRKAVPDYDEALRTAATPIQAKQGLELGGKALSQSMTRDVLEDELSNMTPAQRTFVAQGMRSKVDDTIANVKAAFTDPNMEAREAAKAVKDLSSRAARDKMRMVLGDQAADNLTQRLDQASRAFSLKAAMHDNSKTAQRLMADADMKALTQGGILNKFRNMEGAAGVDAAVKEAGRVVMGRSPSAVQRIEDDVYRAMAEKYTGLRGEEAVRFLRSLQGAGGTIPGRGGLLAARLATRAPAAPAGPAGQGLLNYMDSLVKLPGR